MSLGASLVARLKSPWLAYATMAVTCTKYLNDRAKLVPKWGQWYAPGDDSDPVVLLQVRAFLHGRLALYPHPVGSSIDSFWGRGGVHTGWGLGVPILATPLHLVGRLFGAPGFPDNVRFLIFYAITAVILARALHLASRDERTAMLASTLAAGFVMIFPTFVGMISSRFSIYEETIATGALWSVVLLAGVAALLQRASPRRLVAVCMAAGFAATIRPPLAVYGLVTAALALFIAWKKGMRFRPWLGGLAAYIGVAALYLVANAARFGSPFNTGYLNTTSGHVPVAGLRWGMPYKLLPFNVLAKELFATLFLMDPVPAHTIDPPPSIAQYVVGERFRDYYAPTFDLTILALWCAAVLIVGVGIVRGRWWRRDRTLNVSDLAPVVGAWSLPTFAILFLFYTRLEGMLTRYATDMVPAFAAAALCVGITVVDLVRRRVPSMTGSAQLGIAGVAALYVAGWRGWVEHMSQPWDVKQVEARIAERDARSTVMPPVPDHFVCNQPVPPDPVYGHLDDWFPDCSFWSGMVFALPHQHCVSFTFQPASGSWDPASNAALSGFRANADFDPLVSCDALSVEGNTRRLTMCDPHPPPFLLDGLRLYAIASLDGELHSITDRLRLLRIDAVPDCPHH